MNKLISISELSRILDLLISTKTSKLYCKILGEEFKELGLKR